MSKTIDNIRYSDDLKTVEKAENKQITTAVIKEGVTTIGSYAFRECTNLQNVAIPESVTEIGIDAFKRCKIENYEHKLFKIKNGCFLSSDEKTVLYCTNYSKQEIVIPEGVTTIGGWAFRICTNLQNVAIPEGVTTIEERAFMRCTMLKSVVIPEGVTTIGEGAFEGCIYLQEVKYLGTAKEWRKVKFAKSKEKAEIRKLIKEFTLQDAKDAKIKEIQTVSVEGFMNAMKENYPSFTFQILNSTKTNQVLFVMGGKNATVIQLSSKVSSWNEKFKSFLSVFCDETKTNEEINEAFTTYKIKIAEIKKTFSKPQIDVDEMNLFIDELPEMKDSGSFFYNAKIKKLTFARNTLIDWCTFKYKKSFESIILPKSVTTIGESAFCECTNLQNVVIPDSVTEIGSKAFYHCKIENYDHKLFKIKNGCFLSSDGKTVLYCTNASKQEIVIPEGVTSIGEKAFEVCENLQNVVIPSSITSIGRYAFGFCKNLQSVTIPSSVKAIEGRAFMRCENLQSVTIPSNVTTIGESAFFCCKNLQSVVIPENVTEIGFRAFDSCKIENYEHKLFKVKDGCCFSNDGKTVLYCTNALKQEIVIPEGVTTIGEYAFFECINLQNVVIPSSVKAIGSYAFRSCPKLTVTFDGTKEEWEKIQGVYGCEAENVKFNK